MSARTGALGLLALLALGGCVAPAPWPYPPGPTAEAPPPLAGRYADRAEGSGCQGLDAAACGSLAFHLFSRQVRDAVGTSNAPTPQEDWPVCTQILLEDTGPGLLRVTALGGPDGTQVLARRELSAARGELAWAGRRLLLRPRVAHGAMLWFARRTATEHLALEADGIGLTLRSHRRYDSYLLWVLGGTFRQEETLLRFPRAEAPAAP